MTFYFVFSPKVVDLFLFLKKDCTLGLITSAFMSSPKALDHFLILKKDCILRLMTFAFMSSPEAVDLPAEDDPSMMRFDEALRR